MPAQKNLRISRATKKWLDLEMRQMFQHKKINCARYAYNSLQQRCCCFSHRHTPLTMKSRPTPTISKNRAIRSRATDQWTVKAIFDIPF